MQIFKDKEFQKALIISIILAVVFLIYLILVGIPLTKARNLTISAITNIEGGNYERATEELEEANRIQKTGDRTELLELAKDLSQ